MGTSDEFLIQRATAGDGAALASLLTVFEGKLLAYVQRRLPLAVRSSVGPEDVVQETCYEVCRLIAGFKPTGPGSFDRWATQIARLRIKAAITKHRRRRTTSVSASLGDDASILSALAELVIYRRTPSKSALAHELAIELEKSLERLTADYRQVLTKRFLEGLSVPETASAMSRTSEQVYLLSTRAINALRIELNSNSPIA